LSPLFDVPLPVGWFPSRTAVNGKPAVCFGAAGGGQSPRNTIKRATSEEAEMSEHESDVDPDEIDRRAAERAPVEEAGGGESEGFELAEEELVENAEGVGEGDPLADRFTPEEGDAEDGPAYGEPDEIDSTELDDDDGD
jgi:hypothetical protein